MASPNVPSLARSILVAALALGLVAWHAIRLSEAAAPAIPGPGDAGRIALALHGSTPTMAWSPDGKALAVASAYEYYGWDRQEKAHRPHLGVYVVTAATGKAERVSTEQGYHPLWLSKTVVAWGHSPYERGTAGLYQVDLAARTRTVRRIGTVKGVYHTLAAVGGQILFFSGFPEYGHWSLANPRTGKVTAASVEPFAAKDSWATPSKLTQDQCVQRIGQISVASDLTGVRLTTATQTVGLTADPYVYHTYGDASCSAAPKHCTAVAACLAPDGRRVAFFTRAAAPGDFTLHLQRVP